MSECPIAQHSHTDKKRSTFSNIGSSCQRSEAYLKNSIKEKPYPCCSAMPAHTTLADAPINVPFPKKKIEKQKNEDKLIARTFK